MYYLGTFSFSENLRSITTLRAEGGAPVLVGEPSAEKKNRTEKWSASLECSATRDETPVGSTY